MGIKIDLKCDRCSFEWEDTDDSTIYDNKLYIPDDEDEHKHIYLCDNCMDEYHLTIDNVKRSFIIPITKNQGNTDKIEVLGIVEQQNISMRDKMEMERLVEMRRLQQSVIIKE